MDKFEQKSFLQHAKTGRLVAIRHPGRKSNPIVIRKIKEIHTTKTFFQVEGIAFWFGADDILAVYPED